MPEEKHNENVGYLNHSVESLSTKITSMSGKLDEHIERTKHAVSKDERAFIQLLIKKNKKYEQRKEVFIKSAIGVVVVAIAGTVPWLGGKAIDLISHLTGHAPHG